MKIRTFELALNEPYAIPKTEEKTINKVSAPKPIKRNTGNNYKGPNRVTVGPFIQKLLENNEYLAYEDEAKTNEQIQREILLQFKRHHSLRYQFKSYRKTIGMYRKNYNQQKLYSAQPTPYLVSFQYDEFGFIVIGGNQPRTFKSFLECYQDCVTYKIADPRFIPYELIVEIRNRQNEAIQEWLEWIVPDDNTIEAIAKRAGVKEIYNSVHFARGLTREESPMEDPE